MASHFLRIIPFFFFFFLHSPYERCMPQELHLEKFPYPRDLVAKGFLHYLLDCLLNKYFVL